MKKFWCWVQHCASLWQRNFCDFRPWGSYKTIARGPGYAVKSIVVNPHKRLSLQRHAYRDEHWVVVSGHLAWEVGAEQQTDRGPGDFVHVPAGRVHRLTNYGDVPGVLIEVQLGRILIESDIERLADDYGRS